MSYPEREQARPQVNPNAPCDRCPKSLNPNPSSLNHTLPCWCPMLKPGNVNNKKFIRMKDLQLSEHFTLREFERSATAEKYHINNTVPSQLIPVLQQLCQEVLEPLRNFVGQPIIISSGYRCDQLNVKVGGADASRHRPL